MLVEAKSHTHNLPVRNFRSDHLKTMLNNLFWSLSRDASPDDLIKAETDRFIKAHPRTYPSDTDRRHCLSDKILYFKSPGRDRHGFFRHAANKGHGADCLLNARSRLGGTFNYQFHYDCEPVKGRLASSYPNCHDSLCSLPRASHVNISPNDYVS